MARIKRRDEDRLLAKAAAVFDQHKRILTGFVLTRRELRKLERMGVVEKRLMRSDTGSLIYLWGLVRMPRVTADNELRVPDQQPTGNLKPGQVYRLRRSKQS